MASCQTCTEPSPHSNAVHSTMLHSTMPAACAGAAMRAPQRVSLGHPEHCLSALLCKGSIEIPPAVRAFQQQRIEKKRFTDAQLLREKLARSFQERARLEAQVREIASKGPRSGDRGSPSNPQLPDSPQ